MRCDVEDAPDQGSGSCVCQAARRGLALLLCSSRSDCTGIGQHPGHDCHIAVSRTVERLANDLI